MVRSTHVVQCKTISMIKSNRDGGMGKGAGGKAWLAGKQSDGYASVIQVQLWVQ